MSTVRQRLNNRNNQDVKDISKSATNLFEEGENPVKLRRRRSAAELVQLAEAERFEHNIQTEEAPVLRRRRFTRKQRKSLIIEPETGLILATGQLTSSEEDEADKNEEKTPQKQSKSNSFVGVRKRINGPAARRASRLLKKSQHTSSTSNLDVMMLDEYGLRNQTRSLSVRDLNGENIDFTNGDSVTKWASQILAELDSLPSSRIDLTTSLYEEPTSDSNFLNRNVSTTSLPTWTTREEQGREREDSVSTTIVMQSEGSEDEEEGDGESTPDGKIKPIIGHRELLGKLAELSRPNFLRVSSEPPGGGQPPKIPPPPVPAKRTRFFGNGEKGVVRKRLEEVFNEADRKLQSSIARMTQSVYGDLRTENSNMKNETVAGSRFSIPQIRTISTSSQESEEILKGNEEKVDNLDKWKKKAECRSKVEEAKEEEIEEKPSVNRVISALIRTIEDSRHTALDRPKELAIDKIPKPKVVMDFLSQDAGTQTTPFAASRSSSFDWINDATEGILRDIQTPLENTPRTEVIRNSKTFVESSSDEADREVASLIAVDNKKTIDKSVFDQMDEGLALLLEYGEPSAVQYHKEFLQKQEASPIQMRTSYDSLPNNFRRNSRRSTAQIVDSVYDNMMLPKRNHFSPLVLPKNSTNLMMKSNENINLDKSKENLANNNNHLHKTNSFAKQLAERDADEACNWLKQAGFPQYVKQFEEGDFPIDTKVVERDHGFLGTDSLRSLFRRIDTLNRCAIMKVDNVVMRRRMNNDYSTYAGATYDDEDNVALSNNWHYQRQSQTWNRIPHPQTSVPRIETINGSGAANSRIVSTKPNWQMSSSSSPYFDKQSGHQVSTRTNWYEAPNPSRREPTQDNTSTIACVSNSTSNNSAAAAAAAKLQRSQSERIRDRARAIIKKMDLRSTSRRRKERSPEQSQQKSSDRTLIIGDPVLVSYDTATNESMRMMNSARPTHLPDRGRSLYPTASSQLNNSNNLTNSHHHQSRSKSARRQGVVLLTPSSPESSDPESFIFQRYQRPVPVHNQHRRDCSMPPPRQRGNYGTVTSSEYGMPTRRERTPLDAFLYANGGLMTNSLTRPSRSGGLTRIPPYSEPVPPLPQTPPPPPPPHSNGGLLVARTDQRSHNLVVQSDGYYMHDMPPRNRFDDSPSTSSHLKVETQKCFGESSVDHTTDEETNTMNTNLSSTLNRRRDSGVGSSLSRSPSGPSTQRIRQSILQYCLPLLSQQSLLLSTSSVNNSTSLSSNGSWQNLKKRNASLMASSITSSSGLDETFFTDVEMARSMDSLNIIEIARLRKLAYLQITAMLEKTMGVNCKIGEMDENGITTLKTNPNNNWSVHKLIKKMKINDGKGAKDIDDGGVFGVGLDTIYRRSGFCLPRPILEILRFLRQMAPETVGIFRKNGVKSRIAELRQIADRDPSPFGDVFVGDNSLDSGQVHDVADLLKQYLRDLPEPLMTIKMSEIFSNIFQFVPEVDRLLAVQYALILMPDENREAVQTLMMFLRDVAKYSQVNNMTAQNLAVCFTPSLFQLSASRLDKMSTPTRRHKTIGASGMPTEKEMKETRACQQCLTMLIEYSKTIFMAPDCIDERTDIEQDIPALKDLGLKGPRTFLIDRVFDMIKDHGERWKGWQIETPWCGIEISSKKANDSHPLKTYRVWIDIEAPPKVVMSRIMRERHIWDCNVINWRHLEYVNQPDTDIHQYVLNETISHPTKDVCLVRFHSASFTEIRGACAIAERSVQCNEQQMLGGLSAAVLDQRFLIEPKSGGQSRVNYIARVDLKGRTHQWYNKVYGSIMARQMQRLRDSFQNDDPSNGPETKI